MWVFVYPFLEDHCGDLVSEELSVERVGGVVGGDDADFVEVDVGSVGVGSFFGGLCFREFDMVRLEGGVGVCIGGAVDACGVSNDCVDVLGANAALEGGGWIGRESDFGYESENGAIVGLSACGWIGAVEGGGGGHVRWVRWVLLVLGFGVCDCLVLCCECVWSFDVLGLCRRMGRG